MNDKYSFLWAAESVVLGVDLAVHLTQRWKQLAGPATPLVSSAHKWRTLFSAALQALDLSSLSLGLIPLGERAPLGGLANTRI